MEVPRELLLGVNRAVEHFQRPLPLRDSLLDHRRSLVRDPRALHVRAPAVPPRVLELALKVFPSASTVASARSNPAFRRSVSFACAQSCSPYSVLTFASASPSLSASTLASLTDSSRAFFTAALTAAFKRASLWRSFSLSASASSSNADSFSVVIPQRLLRALTGAQLRLQPLRHGSVHA